MKFKNVLLIFITALCLMSFELPKNIQKKVDKEVKDVFQIEEFILQEIKVSKELIVGLPTRIDEDNFFKIIVNNELVGYIFVDKAPSKTDEFDYLVIFDENLIIKRSKVLVYREDYGSEIGSKRWLKQFEGKTKTDTLESIISISGATISVNSMTKGVNDLLKTINILYEKKIFNEL